METTPEKDAHAKKKRVKKIEPLTMFVFRYYLRNHRQPLVEGPILIIANNKLEAEQILTKGRHFRLARYSIHGTGYKCEEELLLDTPMNLFSIVQHFQFNHDKKE